MDIRIKGKNLAILATLFPLFLIIIASNASATDVNSCQAISSAGSYYVTADLSNATTCVDIQSNNVYLDCQGHSITYATSAFGNGVNTNADYNVTIKNCVINLEIIPMEITHME